MTAANTSRASGDVRFRPDDGCPLFSESLEEHLVAVSRGEVPSRGRFCGNCYTPVGPDTTTCSHCSEDLVRGRKPVTVVPEMITEALRAQRKTESRWVNSLAYVGIIIAIVVGLIPVLAIPFFDNLIWATVLYAILLLIGARSLAGVLGGYYGDRWGYERARANTRATWSRWVEERDRPQSRKGD